jgi:integrase/recombinase XerD
MTIARVLDKKRKIKSGENKDRYHIKIRVTRTEEKKTVQKYFQTGIYATVDEFNKIMGNLGRGDDDLKPKQTRLNEIYENAKSILRENPFIDLESFGNELLQVGAYRNPLALMKSYADKARVDGRIGLAVFYEQAAASFKKYKESFSFGSVTPEWLFKYEKAMIDAGRSVTTVGIYCRALRTTFNLARAAGKIPMKMYPFGKGKYVIPKSSGRKMALTEDQKNEVLKFRSINMPEVQKAVDLFIFSYFCYGMNFKDIALLKYKDVHGDVILIDRAKTKNTERNKELLEIPIRSEVQEIIKNHGNKNTAPSEYVFSILRDGLTPDQVHERVHDFIWMTNKNLKFLADHLGIKKLTTYWARHTFATIAWKKGADLVFIQRALGHSDPKTTQRYLDSFDIETKRKVANLL